MLDRINESDWKILRELNRIALERFCERALSEVIQLASDTRKGAHERYLALFKLIRRRDDEIADAFNDLRRSNAIGKLARMTNLKLLSDEEISRFSPQTRELVEFLLETWMR